MESNLAVNNQVEQIPGCSMCLMNPSSHALAFALVVEGIEAEWNKKYEEAIRYYEESEEYWNHSIEHFFKKDEHKTVIRKKCKEFTDKAKALRKYLNKQREIDEERTRMRKLPELQYEYCDY